MPRARLVTCDVVQPDMARMPRVSALGVPCAAVIGDGESGDPGWCLALASGDLLLLDGDPQVRSLFLIDDMERDELLLMLRSSPDELAWSVEQLRWVYDQITFRGGAVDSLPPNEPLFSFLTVLTTLLGVPEADVRHLWAE